MDITAKTTATNVTESVRFLRLKEVQNRLGVSRSTIYLWIAEGTFPKPVKMGARLVAWPEQAICHWVQQKLDRAETEN